MRKIIMILGSPNDDKGNLSAIALLKVKRGLFEYKKHPKYKILLTGGFGSHFNTSNEPHYQYLKKYLLEKGVSKNSFIESASSENTIEDATLSKLIVDKYNIRNLIVITVDFHLARVKFIFDKIFAGYDVEYIGAPVKIPQKILAENLKHEKEAFKRLKRKGISGYYG